MGSPMDYDGSRSRRIRNTETRDISVTGYLGPCDRELRGELPPWDAEASAPEQVDLLCALIRCQRPEILVEAGTYLGHAAFRIGATLSEMRYGHLHTADPFPRGQFIVLSGVDRVTFYPKDFVQMLNHVPYVDFAYIDASDHSKPDGASLRWRHFEAARSKLRPGGIIAVDDTVADDWRDGEGGRSVQRIRDLCVNFTFLRGMSVYVG